ncbi:MAG: hypothetical protein ABW133_07400 [Polyangiaceae bacterium]
MLWRHLATPELGFQPESNGDEPAVSAAPSSADPSLPLIASDVSGLEEESAGSDRRTAAEIQRCLDENTGVVELTWRALGMKNRFVLIRAIKKHGLEIRRRPGRSTPR